MLDDVRAALARQLPRQRDAPVVPLGSGLDNVAYEVDGELVLRRAREGDPARRLAAARREAALLTALAAVSPLPVPEPVFVDEPTGILAYRKLPGAPLHLNPVARPAELAGPLAEFLTAIHAAVRAGAGGGVLASLVEVDDTAPAEWLAEAAASYRELTAVLGPGERRRVEAFLAAPPPPATPRPTALCHNDLGAEHVLVDAAAPAVTGIIDWTDAALADPAVDFARLHRDLGPDVVERIVAGYGGDPAAADAERVAFYARCALLEDIVFGVTGGPPEYARAGLAHLDRTFG